MTVSRREVLQGIVSAGVGAGAATALAGTAQADSPAPAHDAVGMLYDTTRCIGCKACVTACRKANGLQADPGRFEQPLYHAPEKLNDNTKNIIKLYQEGATRSYMKAQCMHCVDPACVGACMLGALKKREFGIVWWQADKCVGCRYCQMACPYNIPKFEWDSRNPRIVKCEMCRHLIAEGGIPACCDVCPKEAVIYGQRDALLEEARRRLAEHPDRYVNKVYGEHDGGGTQVLYLSHVPFEKLGLPDLGDRSQAATARGVQHTIYQWVLAPVALLALAGTVLTQRARKRSGEATEQREGPA